MSEIINAIVPIDKIKPHKENYNQHPEEQIQQLTKSLESLGQFRSVVIWQQPDGTYVQLAGHGVVEAMKREGATEVRADILPPSLDAMTAKQIMLADNLHAQNSLPDDAALARLLEEQQHAGYDLAALGTDEETLRQMLESLGDEMLENGRTTELNTPKGGEVQSGYNVLIECESEREQQRAYDLVTKEGFTCRVLTL